MTGATAAAERWRELAVAEDARIDLTEAALLIAGDEYPGLDVAAYRSQIDELAGALRRRLRQDISTGDCIRMLNRYVFEELGFTGNDADYYDPRNSYLNDVLDRRVGIPITLSLVYMEIGRRIGLAMHGISFPSHFLVKCVVRDGAIILDPYAGGASLSLDDLRERLAALSQGLSLPDEVVKGLLAAAKPRDILVRMLRNLKGIYLNAANPAKALCAANRIIELAPDAADEYADRGRIYQDLECFRAALTDFESYLSLRPEAQDAAAVKQRIAELRPLAARLN